MVNAKAETVKWQRYVSSVSHPATSCMLLIPRLCQLSRYSFSQWWCTLKSANLYLPCHSMSFFNSPERQGNELSKGTPAGFDQCVQCSELLSRKLCFFCNRQTHIAPK